MWENGSCLPNVSLHFAVYLLNCTNSKQDDRTPELLFASVDASYPDNIVALQALLTRDSSQYEQARDCTFAQHLAANSALYYRHYGRRTLNVGLYMTLFPHTHRCDYQGRPFLQAISDVLDRLEYSFRASSARFHEEPLLLLTRCCDELDTLEA